MVFYNQSVEKTRHFILLLLLLFYFFIQETSWKYFDVFLIYLMSASLEIALPLNKNPHPPPFRKPKIKWAPQALTRLNTVCYISNVLYFKFWRHFLCIQIYKIQPPVLLFPFVLHWLLHQQISFFRTSSKLSKEKVFATNFLF